MSKSRDRNNFLQRSKMRGYYIFIDETGQKYRLYFGDKK